MALCQAILRKSYIRSSEPLRRGVETYALTMSHCSLQPELGLRLHWTGYRRVTGVALDLRRNASA